MACLYSVGLVMTLTGVMFVYGKAGTRFMEHDLKTVRWIECLCGPEFFKNITIITSMWDMIMDDYFQEECKKIDQLVAVPDIAQILTPPSQYEGGAMYHHGLPGGKLKDVEYSSVMRKKRDNEQRSAALRDLIRDRYANCKPVKLQVMKDANRIASYKETEAAKVLMARQSEIEVKISGGRAIVCEKKTGLGWKPKESVPTEIKIDETVERPKSPPRKRSLWDKICGWSKSYPHYG
ncbi:hypothetical protein THARTR1_08342 [Trichoderma harzianum]|uniref:Uncharacterized protein n=1 Tax=Trichoderma harzianum TaxID=5544 RepID=A0A2K0TZQ1_TRIHA|nr:hypothetical protein THARTR1_08342 [Trichoderma harzianum]